MEVVNFCEEKKISIYMLPSSFDIAVSPSEAGSFSGMALIRLRDASLNPVYALVKRVMDVSIALVVLVLGLPIWMLIALLIKLTSKGPVIFAQIRAGLHGRPFTMYKFRSMIADAEEKLKEHVDIDGLEEPVFKIKNDPRVTPLGRILRRYGLDEIPQLVNVLRGEMSLVGPRPEEMEIIHRYNPWQRRRLKAKPGITGYQQVSNRGEPVLSERIKYDLIYLKHQSFFLDVYIILKTSIVLLRGEGTTF
jgi:exopolysaccharide biosynthesis polyprenyl glycosylphosphotransferase